MPINQLETKDFLIDEEITILESGNEVVVPLLGPTLRMYAEPMKLKIWPMGRTHNYVLMNKWNNFVEENKDYLKQFSTIQLWSFRVDQQLCFALAVVERPLANGPNFFGEWNKENARALMCILKCFEEVSGLRVSYNKSKLYGVGANEVELRDMARWMRCRVGDFPFTYLGLPIGENMRRVRAWNTAVEKLKNHLSDWNAKSISFGGRLTLVKSVLGSLPLYYFSMFRVSLSVIK
ncbi:reverse transcriptase domain, reverse transcriptase zinc-binding domain protein, partial [Tanacetum coccineum]